MPVQIAFTGYKLTTGLPNPDLFTFMCWVRVRANNGGVGNVLSATGGVQIMGMGVGTNGNQFNLMDAAGNNGGTNLSVGGTNWYNLCWTRNGNTDNKGYLNGVLDIAQCTLTYTVGAGHQFNIGTDPTFGYSLNCQIYAAKWWERVLTVAEIKNETLRVKPYFTTNYYAEYNFRDTGSALTDTSGHGHTLAAAAVGTPTTVHNLPPLTWSQGPAITAVGQ